MPRLTTFVDKTTEKQVKDNAEQEGVSVSVYTASLIKLALKIKQLQGDENKQNEEEKKAELEEKHTEFLLKILGLQAEVLRCVYDSSKVKNKTGDVESNINRIDEKAKEFIHQFLGKKTDVC